MIDIRAFVPRDTLYLVEGSKNVELLRGLGLVVYSRQELRDAMAEYFLQYAGLYHLFMVRGELHYWIADEQAWRTVPAEVQTQLLLDQRRLNRGYLFDAGWLESLGEEFVEERRRVLEAHGLSEPESGVRFLALTAGIWDELSPAFRQAWFEKRVAEILEEFPEVKLPDDFLWPEQVPFEKRELIRQYAGRTSERSGPNCFAGALGLAVGGPASHTILRQWLHPEPFVRSLAALGYVTVESSFQADDVLVWLNGNGQVVHAAYVLNEELLFQKYGQNWFDPWCVVKFADVEDYAGAVSSGGRIEVYRRVA